MKDKAKIILVLCITTTLSLVAGLLIGRYPPGRIHHVNMKMMPDSSLYTGSIKKKMKEGYGEVLYKDSSIFKGWFHLDKKDGYGQQHYADGTIYDGMWKDDLYNGKGFLSKEGFKYEGLFKCGDLSHGTISCVDFYYSGDIKDLLPHGYGNMKLSNGETFYGNFKNGYKDGLGKLIRTNGTFRFGYFENGRFKVPVGKEFFDGDSVFGIDVSHHQEEIDWDNLALFTDNTGKVFYRKTHGMYEYPVPVSFVFIKATENDDFVDNRYQEYAAEADRHGIVKGAYHFFRYDASAEAQMKNFLQNSRYDEGDLPPVLDVELSIPLVKRSGKDNVQKMVLECLRIIEKERGVKPILYSSKAYFEAYLDTPDLRSYDLWVARYGASDPGVHPYTIWQYTSKGELSGMDPSEDIDIDIFNGNIQKFNQYLDRVTRKKF